MFFAPKNSPSSRCTAIGNHSCMMLAKVSAGSTKNRVGSVTRIELVYRCGTRSPRYACIAPRVHPALRGAVDLSTSSPPTRRESTTVPSSIT
ncbi:hypothetical protein SFUMM280S_10958 [Streptomyces fumanus]